VQIQIEGVKKIDIPINMISAVGETKMAKVSDNVITGLRGYYNKDSNYRNHIETLYTGLEKIRPIDSDINNVLYVEDYIEKGLAIKPSVNTIKQVWTEYRLIYNDKNKTREVKKMKLEEKIEQLDMPTTDSYILNNFDDIFDRLSMKVDGVGKYVEELKDMKQDLDTNITDMEHEKEVFRKEKMDFEAYREAETKKLEEKEASLKNQMEKIENLVKVFDLKISDIVK